MNSKGQGKLSLPGGGKPVLRLPGSSAYLSNITEWERSFAGFPQENEETEKIDLRRGSWKQTRNEKEKDRKWAFRDWKSKKVKKKKKPSEEHWDKDLN